MTYILTRQQLCNEADLRGIAWTHETTDNELRQLIESDDRYMSERPPCFGIWWEDIGDSPCTRCSVKDRCLDTFSKTTLVKVQQLLPEAGIEDLALKLRISESAVLLAIDYQQGPKREPVLKRHEAPQDPPQDPPEDITPEDITEEPEETVPRQKKPPEAVKKAKKKAAKKTTKKAAKKKATKKRKKALPPTRAGSAKSAKDPVKRRRKKPLAKSVRVRAGAEWGKQTHKSRWERERNKSRLVKRLNPGDTLSKTYKKVTYEVKVLPMYYEYAGEVYPTLNSIVEKITGKVPRPKQKKLNGEPRKGTRLLCNWSAVRFFNLGK